MTIAYSSHAAPARAHAGSVGPARVTVEGIDRDGLGVRVRLGVRVGARLSSVVLASVSLLVGRLLGVGLLGARGLLAALGLRSGLLSLVNLVRGKVGCF